MTARDKPLPCIVCGFQLESIDPERSPRQPYAATQFETSGHYGSTAFDPMDGSVLQIVVCDPCLRLKSESAVVVHRLQKYEEQIERWIPPKKGG